MFNSIDFDTLLGKTLVKIVGLDKGNDEVVFYCEDGKKYKMYHEQDGCECVDIEDVIGDFNNLIGIPLVMAEEEIKEGEYGDRGTSTWTFYKLATNKGYVTIRWYGESKGYYSESVDFKEIE